MARIFTDAGAMSIASIAGQGQLFDGGVGSWAFWIFRTGVPAAERGLVGMGDFTTDVGWWVNMTTTGLVNADMPFGTANKVRVSTIATTLNAWTHVVVNSKGNKSSTPSTDFTFYFNGIADAGTSTSNGSGTAGPAGSFAVKIGPGPGTSAAANTTAPPANFGPIAFWNRVLTDAEALALATGAHPLRFRPGLIDFWDMMNSSHETATLGKTTLIAGATVPANTAVNPPMEPMPVWLLGRQRLNPHPRSYVKRYTDAVVAPVGKTLFYQPALDGIGGAGPIAFYPNQAA